jgi:hypothetical protein
MTRRDWIRVCAAAAVPGRREDCDVLVTGGSLGGVAAALAAARIGKRVILTEETDWIGGQATTQGVPLDEHPWVESYGRTQSYADFRERVRDYYRRHYPLTASARADRYFNPGAGWVSACGFEPRAGLAALYEMLAPHLTSGLVAIHTRLKPAAVDTESDRVRAVTFADAHGGGRVTYRAPYILDATETGELLPLARVELVTGAESQAQTGEPTALEGTAEPLRMQPFTHLISVDYLPGEDHTIEKPELYDEFRPGFSNLVGIAEVHGDELQLRMRRLFAPPSPAAYASCIWNFRRVFYAGHCPQGAFPSDVTMLMNGNEYAGGPILGVDEATARRHLRRARQLSLSLLYFLQTEIQPGYEGRRGYPGLRARGDVFGATDGLAQYPYIRESRRIRAEFTILEQHFRTDLRPDGPVVYKDSAGVSGYRMDIHEKGRGNQSRTWELHGKHWVQQLALGALIPVRVENLLPACKNLGVTHVTNGAFRVHPAEWNIGESAGALAAFCLRRGVTPRAVRAQGKLLSDFQRELVTLGVQLHWPRNEYSRSYNSLYAGVPGWYFGESDRLYDVSGRLRTRTQ